MDDSKLTKNKSMNSEACRQSTANTLAEERLACVWISLPSRAVIVAAYGATVGAAVYVFGVVVVGLSACYKCGHLLKTGSGHVVRKIWDLRNVYRI